MSNDNDNDNDIRHGRHCVFLMHVHLVFVTKYRREVFTKAILDDLRAIFASVCIDFESELVEFDGEDDHVHLLVNYPPKVSVSSLVNSLKGVSGRMIRRKQYPSIRKKLWGAHSGRRPTSPEAAAERLSP
jgi:putative transposase